MGIPQEEFFDEQTKVLILVDSENMEQLRQFFGRDFKLDYAKLMRLLISNR